MKYSFVFLLLIPVLSFTVFHPDSLEIGALLPHADTKMKDVSGKEISFNSIKTGKGLLVMFSCNTCPYVIRNQSRTREICAYAQSKGLAVVLVNSNEAERQGNDSFDSMKEYAKEQGYNWYYAVDQNNVIADAFGADRTPECFLFDKDNKLVYHGAIDDNPQDAEAVNRRHLKEAIAEMTTGKDISVKKSRSVGCAIKRI